MKHWFIMDSLKCTCSGDLAYDVWSENWMLDTSCRAHKVDSVVKSSRAQLKFLTK